MTLLEFPVTPSTECSRVSSRSYVFTLDTDSLLITFANETGEPITLLAAQSFVELVSFHTIEITKHLYSISRDSQDLIHIFHSQISVIFTRT